MRARGIKPAFFKNEHLASLTAHARLCFIGLWLIADRSGRLEDRPMRIKAELFPYEDVDCDSLLAELSSVADFDGSPAFIERYTVDGRAFVQIRNFVRHQTPHIKEGRSLIPAPDTHSACTVQAQDKHKTDPSDSLLLIPDSLLPLPDSAPAGAVAGGGGGGGNGSVKTGEGAASW